VYELRGDAARGGELQVATRATATRTTRQAMVRQQMNVISLRRFVLNALAERGSSYMLLGFKATADELYDWSLLSASIPWLHDPSCDYSKLCEDLRRHGLAIVTFESVEEARKILGETRCRRLWVEAVVGLKA
jgi:hypothetical protein